MCLAENVWQGTCIDEEIRKEARLKKKFACCMILFIQNSGEGKADLRGKKSVVAWEGWGKLKVMDTL